MRRFDRSDLPSHSQRYFAQWTRQIGQKMSNAEQATESDRLWKQGRRTKAVQDAAAQLVQMNDQLPWCMYRERGESSITIKGIPSVIIDHWEPTNRSPSRTFDWHNLFMACEPCNTRLKGTSFPEDASGPLLLHPVNDDPMLHIEFLPSNGEFKEKNNSAKGRETIEKFKLKRFNDERRDIWTLTVAALQGYDKAIHSGNRD